MSSLLRWRPRPAADSAQPARQPRDWGTKEVVRFLEQQGLNAYAPAAKKAKLKGTHLLNASTTPFFKSPRISSAPSSPTSSSSSSSSSSSIEHPQLRGSASSPNFGQLRSRSFIFGPGAAGPRRNPHSATINAESEALGRLCDQLGVLSVVDKRRLWLALLNLQRQQDELQSKAAGGGKLHNHNNAGRGPKEPVVGLPCAIKPFAASEKCISLRRVELATRLRSQSTVDSSAEASAPASNEQEGGGAEVVAVDEPEPGREPIGRRRSSSLSSMPLTSESADFFAAEPAPPSGVQSPATMSRRKAATAGDHDLRNAGIAEELVAALSQASPTPKHRSSIGPVATFRKWVTPTTSPTPSPLSTPSLSSPSPSPLSSPSAEETRPPATRLAATSRAVKTTNKARQLPAPTASTGKKYKSNPALAYADQHGVVVVKCCLQLSALTLGDTTAMSIVPTHHSHDSSSSSSSSDNELPEVDERSRRRRRAESTYYDDISLLRLDARRPLVYADLMTEIHRLHGPLLLAILMEEGAKGLGVRVSYRDAEGDLVGVQSDDALRYAYEDWHKMARRRPRKHAFMRLLVEVESTSPQCNK